MKKKLQRLIDKHFDSYIVGYYFDTNGDGHYYKKYRRKYKLKKRRKKTRK